MNDPNRQLRERTESLQDEIDRLEPGPGGGAPRLLVQVFDGGTGNFPTTPLQVALTNPVSLDGDEVEGGAATPTADATQTVPVVFLNKPPTVGDIVTALAIGGRWVAELGGNPCNPCAWACEGIPQPDSWEVFDPTYNITTKLTYKGNLHCLDGTGETYCLWSGTATIDYPGNGACPPVAGLLLTYSVGCFSTVYFGGAANFFWVACGTNNGQQVLCPPVCGYTCPGNTPLSPVGPNFPFTDLFAGLPCVENPASRTITQQGGACAAPFGGMGPPWAVYGLSCTADTSASFTLTPSTSSQNCGCRWWCGGTPPDLIKLTDSLWGPVTLNKSDPATCSSGLSYCTYKGTTTINWPGNSKFTPVPNLVLTYEIYPFVCETACTSAVAWGVRINWQSIQTFFTGACAGGYASNSGMNVPYTVGPPGSTGPTDPPNCGWANVQPINCNSGRPYSQTITESFGGSIVINMASAAWILYGGDCGLTAAIPVTYTLSEP